MSVNAVKLMTTASLCLLLLRTAHHSLGRGGSPLFFHVCKGWDAVDYARGLECLSHLYRYTCRALQEYVIFHAFFFAKRMTQVLEKERGTHELRFIDINAQDWRKLPRTSHHLLPAKFSLEGNKLVYKVGKDLAQSKMYMRCTLGAKCFWANKTTPVPSKNC